MSEKNRAGEIAWVDLTVPEAEKVRDFYQGVVGWEFQPVSMGDYEDYGMAPAGTTTGVAGICHARGVNANLPPQWLIYIRVDDLDRSMDACTARGGRVLVGPKSMGGATRYCVIEDPAGAVAALYAEGEEK